MILSEGAGAVLVGRQGATLLEGVDAGCNFGRQAEAAQCLERVLERLAPTDDDLVVASANGTFVDAAEESAIARHCPRAAVYTPKAALGESVGAGGIWQVICAAQSLQTQTLPPVPQAPADTSLRIAREQQQTLTARRAIVTTCGMNQQVAGLALRRAD
jgi:3-oxoacyl-(acyl-carrier-protein) synthase